MNHTRALTLVGALAGLLTPAAASACAPTDWNCKAVWECHSPGAFADFTAYNACTGGSDVCVAVNHALPLAIYVPCGGSGATQAQPTSLDDFLASLDTAGPGVASAPTTRPTVRTVERDEVEQILEREDLTAADPAPAGATEVTR